MKCTAVFQQWNANIILACDGLWGIWGEIPMPVLCPFSTPCQIINSLVEIAIWLPNTNPTPNPKPSPTPNPKPTNTRKVIIWQGSELGTTRAHPYRLNSLARYFDVTQWSFCAALLQVEHTYRLSAQHMENMWAEGWAHSELLEPRGEHRQMLKRKTIFIQTSQRKRHIRVNW